jgi:hypothetical protein
MSPEQDSVAITGTLERLCANPEVLAPVCTIVVSYPE